MFLREPSPDGPAPAIERGALIGAIKLVNSSTPPLKIVVLPEPKLPVAARITVPSLIVVPPV